MELGLRLGPGLRLGLGLGLGLRLGLGLGLDLKLCPLDRPCLPGLLGPVSLVRVN